MIYLVRYASGCASSATYNTSTRRIGKVLEHLHFGKIMAVYLQTTEEQNQEFQANLESEVLTHADDEKNSNTPRKDREKIGTLVEKVENEVAYKLKLTPSLSRPYGIKINVNGEKTAVRHSVVQVKERLFEVVGELVLQGEKLKGPSGIAVNSKGEIAVTDFDGHLIAIFEKDGKRSKTIGHYGVDAGELRFPVDVTYVNDDVILVADEWNHRIQQFHIRTGEVVKSFGRFGAKDGEFASPVGVCLDDNGHVFVAELNNNRIQVLTRDGQALYKVGDTFDHPLSCVTHKNLLFVSDSRNNCIKVFDVSGKFLYKFGEGGEGDGQFKGPFGLCVDRGGELLVCDQFNGRVQQFTLDGRFTRKCALGSLRTPWGITTTEDGRILVTDYMARKIHILKSSV